MAIPVTMPDPTGAALMTDVILTVAEHCPGLLWALFRLPKATLRFPTGEYCVTVLGPDGDVVAGADHVPLDAPMYKHLFLLDRRGTGFLAAAEITWIKFYTVLQRPDALTVSLTMGAPPPAPER